MQLWSQLTIDWALWFSSCRPKRCCPRGRRDPRYERGKGAPAGTEAPAWLRDLGGEGLRATFLIVQSAQCWHFFAHAAMTEVLLRVFKNWDLFFVRPSSTGSASAVVAWIIMDEINPGRKRVS